MSENVFLVMLTNINDPKMDLKYQKGWTQNVFLGTYHVWIQQYRPGRLELVPFWLNNFSLFLFFEKVIEKWLEKN